MDYYETTKMLWMKYVGEKSELTTWDPKIEFEGFVSDVQVFINKGIYKIENP